MVTVPGWCAQKDHLQQPGNVGGGLSEQQVDLLICTSSF